MTGFMTLFLRFVLDWVNSAYREEFFVKALFLDQLSSFFIAVLLLGFLGTFFVRAFFASPFFIEHFHAQKSLLKSLIVRLFLPMKERNYRGQRMVLGMFLSLLLGFGFMVLLFEEWYLALPELRKAY